MTSNPGEISAYTCYKLLVSIIHPPINFNFDKKTKQKKNKQVFTK